RQRILKQRHLCGCATTHECLKGDNPSEDTETDHLWLWRRYAHRLKGDNPSEDTETGNSRATPGSSWRCLKGDNPSEDTETAWRHLPDLATVSSQGRQSVRG